MCLDREFRGIAIESFGDDAAATRAGRGVRGIHHETLVDGDHTASEPIEGGDVLLTKISAPRQRPHIVAGSPFDNAVLACPESPRQALRVDTGHNRR